MKKLTKKSMTCLLVLSMFAFDGNAQSLNVLKDGNTKYISVQNIHPSEEANALQQMCFAQLVASSTGNMCFGNCNGTINCYPAGTGPYSYSWSTGATSQNISGLCVGTYFITMTDIGDGGKTCTGSAIITEPSKLIVSITSSGSTATVTATGGSPSYAYVWLPGGQTTTTATGLALGTYTVSVTDKNSCTATATVTIMSTGINNGVPYTPAAIYPNPVSDKLTVELNVGQPDKVKFRLVNILGEIVFEENILTDNQLKHTMDISDIPQGVYLTSVQLPGGKTIINKIVKQ